MTDRVNIFWQFFIVILVEEEWNGHTLYCHGSKTGHYRLEANNQRRERESTS